MKTLSFFLLLWQLDKRNEGQTLEGNRGSQNQTVTAVKRNGHVQATLEDGERGEGKDGEGQEGNASAEGASRTETARCNEPNRNAKTGQAQLRGPTPKEGEEDQRIQIQNQRLAEAEACAFVPNHRNEKIVRA